MSKESDAELAMRCRLLANRYDPENPSRDFPSATETRDLLNDAARRLEARRPRRNYAQGAGSKQDREA